MSRRPLRTALKWGAARWPEASFAAASAVGWATQALGRGVDAGSIRCVLPDLEPAELEAVRRATWSSSLRSHVLAAAVVAGAPRPYPRLRSGPDPGAIRPPAVLASFHVGPLTALGLLFEQLPAEVLVLQAENEVRFPPRPGRTILHVGSEDWQRAAAFRRALEALRSSEFVFLAVDGYSSSLVEVPLFGRRVGLARGAFALARMSGAPIVPLTARWRGAAVEIVAGDAITPADEHTMAAAFARWIELRVRETPGEILPSFVDLLRSRSTTLTDDAFEQRLP